jgi:branched-chain amino acid transport system substrate-binding protein
VRTKLAFGTLATFAVGLVTVACSSPSSGGGGSAQSSGSSGSGGASAAQKAAQELGIDLSKCPTDITKPLTGTVKVGATLALTGPVAPALAPLGVGMKAAIADLNAHSGLPIKFSLTIKDDQFAPDKTAVAAQELMQSDKVDFMDGTVGTANVAAVEPLAQKYCVPLIAGNAGGRSVNDPSKYPFTTLWGSPSYADVKGWFQYLQEKFPNGAKIALMTANTDSGQNYLAAADDLAKGTKYTIVSKTTLDATDTAAPSSQVTTMKSSGANVLLASVSPGPQCASLVNEVAQQGWKPDAFMITNSCSTLALMTPAGKAAQGVLCNLWLNDPSASTAASDAGLQQIIAAIKKYQPGQPISGSTVAGYSVIQTLFKAAEQAANSNLGLSRLGILHADWHLTFQSSAWEPGLVYSLDFPKDVVNLEAEQLSSFDATSGQWQKIKVYDFNGQLTGTASA